MKILFTVKSEENYDVLCATYFDVFTAKDIEDTKTQLENNCEQTMGEPIVVEVGRDFHSVVAEVVISERRTFVSQETIDWLIESHNIEQKLDVSPKDLLTRLQACDREVTPIYGVVGPDDHEDIVALMVDYH